MIILEWLSEYITTPKMEMTTEIEALGLVAIGIIAFVIIGVFSAVWAIGAKFAEYIRKREKRK